MKIFAFHHFADIAECIYTPFTELH
uniref:Uncharacterized protein n=1 Tax=Anguilla anguilla TaxID=7936 RepID=A0A0E9VM42_ANGAN